MGLTSPSRGRKYTEKKGGSSDGRWRGNRSPGSSSPPPPTHQEPAARGQSGGRGRQRGGGRTEEATGRAGDQRPRRRQQAVPVREGPGVDRAGWGWEEQEGTGQGARAVERARGDGSSTHGGTLAGAAPRGFSRFLRGGGAAEAPRGRFFCVPLPYRGTCLTVPSLLCFSVTIVLLY